MPLLVANRTVWFGSTLIVSAYDCCFLTGSAGGPPSERDNENRTDRVLQLRTIYGLLTMPLHDGHQDGIYETLVLFLAVNELRLK